MDTEALRVPLTVTMTVFLVVCAAFFLHHLGAGLMPDGVESWSESGRWLMWTATALIVASAPAGPPLSLTTPRPGEDR
ncbi:MULTISPECIES: hypothetical protein [unclassified Streptosporangium]|uniref:hypothetical protein n=1 Tax=unclassified Streptosporangium TaxID=2632669 RepID=UPI002E2E2685|nr:MULTISPECIES: hypothetical protein [unclassified Streptosporangium]